LFYFQESLRLNTEPGKLLVGGKGRDSTAVLISYSLIASVYRLTGERDAAIESLTQALRLALRGGDSTVRLLSEETVDPSLTWPILASLGDLFRERATVQADPRSRVADLEVALRRYRQAFSVIETTRQKQRAAALRIEEEARIGYTGGKV